MSAHLQRQLEQLKRLILRQCARVEEAVAEATAAIDDRDGSRAQQIIANDKAIDLEEVQIEEECLHTLALYQPVAFDLRYVISTLKINSELERIGDLAVNIARLALLLSKSPPVQPPPFDLAALTQRVREMVKQSLDALVNVDPDEAERVRQTDAEVDRIHREMYMRVERAIRQDPELVQPYVNLLGVSRNLERVADHAVNVAEDVIYLASGEIRRASPPTIGEGAEPRE